MWIRRILLAVALGLPGLSLAVSPSDRPPSEAEEPALTVTRGGESSSMSLAELEALGHYDFRMQHPEGLEGEFTGVRIDDLLRAKGLEEADRVRLVAWDDYTTYLTPDERAEKDYFVVTRFEGEPIPPDELGPFLLVVPDDAEAVRQGNLPMTRWIWSLVEIRAR